MAAASYIGLTSQDRFDPLPDSRFIELFYSEQVSVIGHRHSRHAVAKCFRDQLVGTACAIQDGVL